MVDNPRPRLICRSDRWAALKAQADTGSGQVYHCYERLKALKTNVIGAAAISSSSVSWSKEYSRTFMNRILALAACYRMDPAAHANAGDRVVQDVMDACTLSKTSNWAPGEWLRYGEVTLGVAVGFDWCYQRFTASQRTTVMNNIKSRGLDPWYNKNAIWTHNWAAVILNGVQCQLIAVEDEATYSTSTYWTRQLDHCKKGAFFDERNPTPPGKYEILYNPLTGPPSMVGGGEKEGAGYINYYMERLTMILEGYLRYYGTAHPLWAEVEPLTAGAARFYNDLQSFNAPGAKPYTYRFSDGVDQFPSRSDNTWAGYYGQALNDDFLRWIQHRSTHWQSTAAGMSGKDVTMWMIHYDGPGQGPAATGQPKDVLYNGGWWISRGGFNSGDQYLGMRTHGNVWKGHTHLDRGSLVYMSHNRAWLTDLGEDRRTAGTVKFNDKRYDDFDNPAIATGYRWRHWYRLRAEGHNTLCINPNNLPDQRPGSLASDYTGVAEKAAKGVDSPSCVTDLTELYSGETRWANVTSVRRGVKLVNRRYLVVRDEIRGGASLNVWSFFHTRNPLSINLTANDKVAEIVDGSTGYKCRAQIISTQGAWTKRHDGTATPNHLSSSTDLLTGGTSDDMFVNTAFPKLAINLSASTIDLEVVFYPVGPNETAPTSYTSQGTLDSWSATDTEPPATDTTPPAAPTGLSTTGLSTKVRLKWTANTETDLAGYNIYRSTVSGGDPAGTYEALNATTYSGTTYDDEGLVNGTTYYYVITAVDNSGNESVRSTEVAGTPVVALTGVQTGRGESTTTSDSASTATATFANPATANNILIAYCAINKDSGGGHVVPEGFTMVREINGASISGFVAWKKAVGGEQTFTASWSQPRTFVFAVKEYTGLVDARLDSSTITPEPYSDTAVASITTTPSDPIKDVGVAVGAVFIDNNASFGGTAPNYAVQSWSDGFSSTGHHGNNGLDVTPGVGEARKSNITKGETVKTTATWTTADQVFAVVLVLREPVSYTIETLSPDENLKLHNLYPSDSELSDFEHLAADPDDPDSYILQAP